MDDIRPRGNSPTHVHEPDTVQVEVRGTASDWLTAVIHHWKDYKAGCGSPSTCSTPSGGKSWGCCDETSCYIPATCEDASAPDCGGTAASLCPYSPIMKCTYGASSRCVYFVYQTASDDSAKLTSWGCDETPTTYIIGPLQAEQTASETASTNDETDSSSGLSKDATIVLAVLLPVIGLAILLAAAMLFCQRRKKRAAGNAITAPAEGVRSEMEQTMDGTPAPAPPPYEMDDNVLRTELDSREVRYRTN
ncbi:LRR receptor-like serine threonine kinase [Fusarium mundagurra]|uniref:LRR receptor-like serine threonine kinase n=1 Tax=Fusarium mundagurra TaxID=1567541 RepID=A0A8H5YJ89_9HYPO|nr:LRR receptor-like serine threonine kinase [Fusarium mundagurra]